MGEWEPIATETKRTRAFGPPTVNCQPKNGRFTFNKAARGLGQVPEFLEPVRDSKGGRFGLRVSVIGLKVCRPGGSGMTVNCRALCEAMGLATTDKLQSYGVELVDGVYVLTRREIS